MKKVSEPVKNELLKKVLTRQIISQLPEDEDLKNADDDIIKHLSKKYGEPEISYPDSDTEELLFPVADNQFKILRERHSAILKGFIILAQMAPPPPCPRPRVLGAMTITGSGTGDFYYALPFTSGIANSTAHAEALLSFLLSYRAVERTFCAMCIAPCVCNVTATGVPVYTITSTTIWKWIFPVGTRIKVVISLPIVANCV